MFTLSIFRSLISIDIVVSRISILIIKKLRNNKDILITKPDTGNEFIIVNRAINICQVYMKLLMIRQKF